MLRILKAIFRRRPPLENYSLAIRTACIHCFRDMDTSNNSSDERFTCALCLQTTCLACFALQVKECGEDWFTELRCRRCCGLYWPTTFHNGLLKRTVPLIAWVQRKNLSEELMLSLRHTPGPICDICREAHAGDFEQCTQCTIRVCWECFLRNYSSDLQYNRCPGCRGMLSTDSMMESLERRTAEQRAGKHTSKHHDAVGGGDGILLGNRQPQ